MPARSTTASTVIPSGARGPPGGRLTRRLTLIHRWRFVAAVVFDLSMFLEVLTPLAPSLFLPLASLANVGKVRCGVWCLTAEEA